MEMKKILRRNYVCINCGSDVKELHKKFGSSVLKIMNCDNCQQTADKYIEFEPVIILIDLLLLSQPAYRHVLYNTNFELYSKVLVVQLLFDSYRTWKDGLGTTTSGEYRAEKEFYFAVLTTIIDYLILFFMLRIFTWKFVGEPLTTGKSQTTHLVKAITLANIAKFFMIPIVIWHDNATEIASPRLVLVNCYYFVTLVHVLAVIVNCSRKHAFLMALVTLSVKYIVMSEATQRLKQYVVF